MKVILLSGAPSSGKTTTLNKVYDELIELGAVPLRPKKQLGGNPNDFECVLTYMAKQIAIFTMGDFAIEVIHAMSFYEGMGCDVLIVANSDKTMPVKRLSRYPSNVHIWKTMPLNNESNESDKNFIISHI